MFSGLHVWICLIFHPSIVVYLNRILWTVRVAKTVTYIPQKLMYIFKELGDKCKEPVSVLWWFSYAVPYDGSWFNVSLIQWEKSCHLLCAEVCGTESWSGWGWEGSLEVTWSNTPSQPGSPRADCPGYFWREGKLPSHSTWEQRRSGKLRVCLL